MVAVEEEARNTLRKLFDLVDLGTAV